MDGHIQAAKARPDHVFDDLHTLTAWLTERADQASKKE
jgi:4-nitrophenyl phosphatase